MVAVKRNFKEPLALVAATMMGVALAGCGPTNGTTCAEATYEDVSNLEAGIIGMTVDDLGIPIAGARVFIPGTQVDLITDANGRFSIAAALLNGEEKVEIWAEKAGFPDKVLSVKVPGDSLADAIMVMKPYTGSDIIEALEGGTVTDGIAKVTFLPNSLKYVDNGELVSGPVEISVVSYRPDRYDEMEAAPGSLFGVTPERDGNGNITGFRTEPIRTYGMADVSMMQNGRQLELVEGKPATVVLENIVEGYFDEAANAAFNDTYRDFVKGADEPTIMLWHFNYETAMWDRVEGEDWTIRNGSEGGYLTLTAQVPEFSPCNPDDPPVVCNDTIDVVDPEEDCVCKNIKHANGVEPVRGAAISVYSRAWAYTYRVTTCSDGTSSRVLVSKRMQTSLTRATTDSNGNFCAPALWDVEDSSMRRADVYSVKTYFPGRLDDEDKQYQVSGYAGALDDDGDGKIDAENMVGYLGDTHRDQWLRLNLGDLKACGPNGNPPEGPGLEVECINDPVDPKTGKISE